MERTLLLCLIAIALCSTKGRAQYGSRQTGDVIFTAKVKAFTFYNIAIDSSTMAEDLKYIHCDTLQATGFDDNVVFLKIKVLDRQDALHDLFTHSLDVNELADYLSTRGTKSFESLKKERLLERYNLTNLSDNEALEKAMARSALPIVRNDFYFVFYSGIFSQLFLLRHNENYFHFSRDLYSPLCLSHILNHSLRLEMRKSGLKRRKPHTPADVLAKIHVDELGNSFLTDKRTRNLFLCN